MPGTRKKKPEGRGAGGPHHATDEAMVAPRTLRLLARVTHRLSKQFDELEKTDTTGKALPSDEWLRHARWASSMALRIEQINLNKEKLRLKQPPAPPTTPEEDQELILEALRSMDPERRTALLAAVEADRLEVKSPDVLPVGYLEEERP